MNTGTAHADIRRYAAHCAPEGFRHSWTAYAKLVLVYLVPALLAYLLHFFSWHLTMALSGLLLVCLALQVMSVRSVRLLVDNDGVWVHSGIFPWSRGVNGVKWRDLQTATFNNTFFSWALGAYTIRIGHRYTKDSAITLKHVRHGDKAAALINILHIDQISQNMGA